MSAKVTSILADGRLLTVTAIRRPRDGRADIKCSAPNARLAERVQQVARLARLTEAKVDSREQVLINLDLAPGTQERDWELAVVLADRIARGLWQADAPVLANGWSDAWQLGRVEGHTVHGAPPQAILGGVLHHLGALSGQPDVAGSVGTARAWFPLHSGGELDALCWVEVNVYPLDAPGVEEEDTIVAPQLDAAGQRALRQVLAGARQCDGRGLGRWRTVVRFAEPRFQGNSYELALVLADRLARGREFVPRGRIIASGASSAWHAGRVEAVEGCAPKCALIARSAQAGDRVLLPKAWEATLPAGWLDSIAARGASVALVERIGII